jgi:hypothetical protein
VDGDVWTANLEPTTGDVISFESARDVRAREDQLVDDVERRCFGECAGEPLQRLRRDRSTLASAALTCRCADSRTPDMVRSFS